jgi:hypothetical protein
LAVLGKGHVLGGGLSGGAGQCFLDYWQDGPWVEHLRRNVPAELRTRLTFRPVAQVAAAGETICYPAGAGAIQIRGPGSGAPETPCKIWVWYPGTDPEALAVFEAWFWKESARYFREQAAAMGPGSGGTPAALEGERSSLHGSADTRTAATAALVLFALFISCVYLLPSGTCEERERGLLLALVLSPASPLEILAARCVFYAGLGCGLAALVVAIDCPAALGRAFFWLALLVTTLGALGIGLTIASVTGTQRLASVAALGYTLAVAVVLSACHATGAWGVSWLALEYHGPRLLHAALAGTVEAEHMAHLAAAAGLAAAWGAAGLALFRRQGWQ